MVGVQQRRPEQRDGTEPFANVLVDTLLMNIRIATSDEDIEACYPVMQELRPHIVQARFLSQVRSQQNAGYRLAMLQAGDDIVAVAGFRISENLAWGRFLYVDDLVTAGMHRSRGNGAALLAWLKRLALAEGCAQLHLDSGMQRIDAHRFYQREGLNRAGFHFSEAVSD